MNDVNEDSQWWWWWLVTVACCSCLAQAALSITDFINKELIQFSRQDCIRSIPSMVDGLKPSQRKVLYGCLRRGLTKEIKVIQLSGYEMSYSWQLIDHSLSLTFIHHHSPFIIHHHSLSSLHIAISVRLSSIITVSSPWIRPSSAWLRIL